MGTIRWQVSPYTTTPSSSGPSAQAPIWLAWADDIPTNGIVRILIIRGMSCLSRICPASLGSPTTPVDANGTAAKMKAMRLVGVPYSEADIAAAHDAVAGHTEQDALIDYLQMLGTASKSWVK
jgi:hypothetical protein